mmetsp:Transcript_15085/g.52955  ORF Transcript_15085/g.52955 Transcript_15085/m.52955 type:complete len:345 (-) Transcript_15085:77-1111(-)
MQRSIKSSFAAQNRSNFASRLLPAASSMLAANAAVAGAGAGASATCAALAGAELAGAEAPDSARNTEPWEAASAAVAGAGAGASTTSASATALPATAATAVAALDAPPPKLPPMLPTDDEARSAATAATDSACKRPISKATAWRVVSSAPATALPAAAATVVAALDATPPKLPPTLPTDDKARSAATATDSACKRPISKATAWRVVSTINLVRLSGKSLRLSLSPTEQVCEEGQVSMRAPMAATTSSFNEQTEVPGNELQMEPWPLRSGARPDAAASSVFSWSSTAAAAVSTVAPAVACTAAEDALSVTTEATELQMDLICSCNMSSHATLRQGASTLPRDAIG